MYFWIFWMRYFVPNITLCRLKHVIFKLTLTLKRKKIWICHLCFFFIFLRERERLVFVGYAHFCPLLQLVRTCYFYIWKLLHFSNIISLSKPTEHRDNVNFYLILIKVLRVFKVHGWRGWHEVYEIICVKILRVTLWKIWEMVLFSFL